jgi:PIN domain nuclease of toxin-antitoxin system
VETFCYSAKEIRSFVKLLLDTNALIWWMEDKPMLGPQAREILANPSNSILATAASLWEITLKWRVGKYHLPGSAFINFLSEESITLIDIHFAHIEAVEKLDTHHKDPFDHLILAQAKVEGATIITSDREMASYGVPCIPAMR